MTNQVDGAAERRAIFLDVDWTLLRPAATAIELWLAALEKRQPSPLPVRAREAPITVQVPHHDRPVTVFHRPAVLRAIRNLPGEVDLFWLTSWMTNPDRLTQLQVDLGLPASRIQPAPLPANIAAGRPGLPSSARLVQHWKFQSVAHYLRTHVDTQALWVDDEVGRFVHHLLAADLQPRLHYLRPASWNSLLTEADAARIGRWATGDLAVLRHDRNDHSDYGREARS